MASARIEDELAAPVDAVWRHFADFGDLRGWAPGTPKVTLDGDARTVGTVRLVEAEGQPAIRERLAAYDAAAKTFSYEMLGDTPFPFERYHATVRLGDAGDGRTTIAWSSTFEPRGMPEASVVELIGNIYRMFIGNLKKTLAGS